MSNLNTQQNDSPNQARNLHRLFTAFALTLALVVVASSATAGPFSRARSVVATKVKAAPAKLNPANILEKIEKKIDSLPKPFEVLGDAKETIDETIQQTVGQIKEMSGDMKRFKGAGCDIRQNSECSVLKRRLKGIYTNLRGIRDIVPGYDFLPDPASRGIDPMGNMIDKIPAPALFGMSSIFQNLTVLDDLEMISVWIDQLRFYTLVPVEEDLFYRLPQEECDTLEHSILADNEIFDRMMKVMNVTAKISGIAADILPRDITVVVAGGTAIPNPILPVMVLSENMSSDFHEFLEKELEERGKLVKKCRTQQFRNDTQYKLDTLLGW